MNFNNKNYYVITGGPGVGKTTLLNQLGYNGYKTIPEDARRIIKEQMAGNKLGLPWKNKKLYAQLMLDESLKTLKNACHESTSEITFFDRGLLDAICYMRMENIPVSKATEALINQYTYAQTVFILPPWKAIYETDDERKQTWSEGLYTFGKMRETYRHYGYEVIEIPKDTVVYRAKFITDFIKNN